MNYTLEEIRKHKNKIYDLSNKLINTFDINQEIMINNKIKFPVCSIYFVYRTIHVSSWEYFCID